MRLSRPQVAQGASIPITVRVVPVSAQAREALQQNGLEPVRLIVLRSGRSLPDPHDSSLCADLGALRRSRVRHVAGGTLELDTDLSYWAAIDRPGRHDVVVEFAPGERDPSFPPARSQPMMLTVTARPAAEIARSTSDISARFRTTQGVARSEAVRALGASRSTSALGPLLSELYATDESSRWVPAALGLLPERGVVVRAVREALASRGISGSVAEVLLCAGDPAAGLVLTAQAALASPDTTQRRNAAAALAVLARVAPPADRRAAIDVLIPMVTDPDPAIRLLVVGGIEPSPDDRTLQLLVSAARDSAATVRMAAIRALRSRRAVHALLDLLGRPGGDLVEVARAVAQQTDLAARRALHTALGARAMPMRLACARALWEVGDRAGKGVLLLALRSRDDALRAELIDWLTAVSGRTEQASGIPELALAWSRWLQQVP